MNETIFSEVAAALLIILLVAFRRGTP